MKSFGNGPSGTRPFGPKTIHGHPASFGITPVSGGDVSIEVWGTGKATREFFYAGHAAEAIFLAMPWSALRPGGQPRPRGSASMSHWSYQERTLCLPSATGVPSKTGAGCLAVVGLIATEAGILSVRRARAFWIPTSVGVIMNVYCGAVMDLFTSFLFLAEPARQETLHPNAAFAAREALFPLLPAASVLAWVLWRRKPPLMWVLIGPAAPVICVVLNMLVTVSCPLVLYGKIQYIPTRKDST